jgi:hypothetical protein
MQKVDLTTVLDLLINEEQEQASGLLHQWFVEKSKSVHESLMQEDDSVLEGDLTQKIEDDQEQIKSEEYYSEAEGDDEEAEGEVEGGLEAADDDMEADLDAPADVDMDAPMGDMDVLDEPVVDEVPTPEALMAKMDELKAEFMALMAPEMEANADDGDEEADMPFNGEKKAAESFAFESAKDKDKEDESLEEADDFADLEESWNLEPVADPALSGAKEIGAAGAKVSLNDKSPIPQKKGEARVGGAAVEINAEEHKGYERESSPEVKARPLLKNQVKKSTDGRTGVSKEGDKSAMLNKKDGFGSDSPKSPIGAGAADLRGSDIKRK